MATATAPITTEDLLALPENGMERWLLAGELRERPMTRRNGLLQVDGETIVGVELACMGNEDVREIGIDAPVASLIGFGQGVAGDRATKAQVIELWLDRVQTGFDIAEAVPVGELRKSHAEALIEAGEVPGAIIALVLEDAAIEIAFR